MITSDKQHKASKNQLAMLQESFNVNMDKAVPEIVRNASKAQLQDLMAEIQTDIAEYERIKSTQVEDIAIQSIDDLLVAPIRYRIASHMSLDTFGRQVGVSARQIHRYEAENYSNVTIGTLTKILKQLGVELHGHMHLAEEENLDADMS